jgi:hypothetical protein
MLHACLCTICLVFCYTSWHFYAFSRTNLLTRCHSVSSLFSAIFVFQKSYTGNILRIGRNKSQSSYFSRHEMESKAETEGGSEGGHTPPRCGPPPGSTREWCGPLVHLLTSPFRLYILLDEKTLRPDRFSRKHTASRRRRWCEIGRVQKLFLAPCRREESPPEAFFITMPASGVMCE